MNKLLLTLITIIFAAILNLTAMADEPISGEASKIKAKAAEIDDDHSKVKTAPAKIDDDHSKVKTVPAKIDDDHSKLKTAPVKHQGVGGLESRK